VDFSPPSGSSIPRWRGQGFWGTCGKARMDATPLGRFGKPSDIALGCLNLASDDAAWVTGSELVIDGGMAAN
jgi:NAD(P)-dependent dehydrogenase (short-subunit alcohol dehydrogenase family)